MSRLHRLDQGRSDARATLVLLHGLGSNEADLFSFADELDPRLNVIALRAPFDYMGGFAWFDVGWTENGIQVNGEQAQNSLDNLIDELADLKADRLILGGFSQGAMMALGVLLQRPDLLSGAVLLSGALLPNFVRTTDHVDVPVFQSHGTFDPVLPISLGREVRQALEARATPLAYHEYPMGHEVNYACLRDVDAWLRDTVDKLAKNLP